MQVSGSNLAYFTKNTTFDGFNQKVQVDTSGEVKTNYVILDSDRTGSQLYQTFIVDLKLGVLRFAGRSIHFPGGSPPAADSRCWFDDNVICTGGWRLLNFNLNVVLTVLSLISNSPVTLFSHIVKLNVLILRCGGDVRRHRFGCHSQCGCRRTHHKFLHQVQPSNIVANQVLEQFRTPQMAVIPHYL